ncbi:unnamed protein product [Adineta steineri]|uniref:Homeobox domain-containing protein n=1 Tax=Adineta steineri TaxID=433720 RepID=A0A819EJ26_9BILA|nr:unnamed protein product [Adineta steineri]CAF1203319.1 unnamed protein product [Adineta steineri]CAF3523863.1 unnamed protein product [Adineta steineri]CAF3851806.1 unnamed protein product [Adineta steineri]
MDDNSSSFVQLHRDDSGYGSPILNREFLSPQQSSSSTYYSYQHTYHPHVPYSNNSFHMYDQLIGNNNIYNNIDSSMTLPSLEQSSVSSTMDLCSSPIPICTNSSSTPSKDSANNNICPPYEYKINWVPPQGRRRRQRTVFTQTNVQQLDSVFVHNQYPDIELREALAAQMGVPESRIQVWFKNRRTRARTAHRQQLKLSESSSSH